MLKIADVSIEKEIPGPFRTVTSPEGEIYISLTDVIDLSSKLLDESRQMKAEFDKQNSPLSLQAKVYIAAHSGYVEQYTNLLNMQRERNKKHQESYRWKPAWNVSRTLDAIAVYLSASLVGLIVGYLILYFLGFFN